MPNRWLLALSAAGFGAGVAVLAVSCGGGSNGSPGLADSVSPTGDGGLTTTITTRPIGSSDGGDGGAPSCGTSINTGCPCDTPGQQIGCGQVHHLDGDYLSCSTGTRSCSASGQWGDCLGDQIGEPRSTTRFLLDSLQLEAGTCVDDPCDPSCENFVDNAAGGDSGIDSGLVWADSGVSLTPIYPDAGIVCTGFAIAPLDQTITVTYLPTTQAPPNTLPTVAYSATQQYTATALPAGCFTDVVPALWGMDRNDIGTFESTTGYLTIFSGIGTFSKINIAAFVGGLPTQFTKATILVNAQDVSQAGPYATSFAATPSGSDPGNQILYPYDGTVLPLGLQPPIVQWNNNGSAADAVQITLRYPDTSPVFTWQAITSTESPATTQVPGLETATGQPAAPRFAIDSNIWTDFEQTAKGNATAGGLGQPAIISVQRIVGGHLYPESKVKVYFAPGQLKGKVYYNSYGTQLVKNSPYTLPYDPANPYIPGNLQVGGATLAISPGADAPTLVSGVSGPDGQGCRVCHTLSGNGETLLSQDGQNYGVTHYTNILTGAPTDQVFTGDTSGTFAWAGLTFSADFAVSHAGPQIAAGPAQPTSVLFNMSAGGTPIPTSGLGATQMSTPSFASNDQKITFNYWNADTRSLGLADFNPVTTTFGGIHLAYTPPSGQVVWPTFTPGNDQVVFSTQYGGQYAFTWGGSSADLWRYDLGSNQAARMDNANGKSLPTNGTHSPGEDEELNFEPTMNPTDVANTGGFAWVVFTSRRLFGNVATVDPFCSDARNCPQMLTQPTTKKLWMAAVNPTTGGTADPSSPAFYLPGQELLAGNQRGFWVLDQCKLPGSTPANACDTDLDCCQPTPNAEYCVAANSVPPIKKFCQARPVPGLCAPDLTACTATSECCGALTGSQCILGSCTPPPPLVTFSGASFTRDYVGSCPPDYGVVWRYFSWKSYTPGNSFIQFTGQTADSSADIVGMTPPPVDIGKAYSNPVAQTIDWTSAAKTVDDYFQSAGQTSNTVLRVTAYLDPATAPSQTPVLEDWRATYDCVPSK